MNFYLDIGNSRLKSACDSTTGLQPFRPVAWRDVSLSEHLDQLWAGYKPSNMFVCNVAEQSVLDHLESWCKTNWQLDPQILASTSEFKGLRNGYHKPETLGTDRWAAMVGARVQYAGGLCVIDSGTATTVDLIDANGLHLGGAILPGVYTMRRALGKYTASLFTTSGDIEPFSRDTAAGIAGGTGYASAGAIDRLIDEGIARLGELTVVFTGGEAALVAPLLRHQVIVDELLVLSGVAALAEDS